MIRLEKVYSVVLLGFSIFTYSVQLDVTTIEVVENESVRMQCNQILRKGKVYYTTESSFHFFRRESDIVHWYKDDGSFTPILTSGALILYNVDKRMNNSIFTCMGKLNDDSYHYRPLYSSYRLLVLTPPSVEPNPASGYLKARLGEEVTLSCNASGSPEPKLTWKFKGEEMQLPEHNKTLKFVASNGSLAGYYECVANNSIKQPASAFIQLDIIYAPELTSKRSRWIHTALGRTVILDCTVSPATTDITWLKGDNNISRGEHTKIFNYYNNSILLIKNFQTEDFGKYACSARNSEGEAKIHFEISGLPNIAVFKTNAMKEQDSIESYTLIWEVFSYTPIVEYSLLFREYKPNKDSVRYDWTKLTIPAEHTEGDLHTMLYTIKGLKGNTKYEALVMSRNKYGWSQPSPTLRFDVKGTDTKQEESTTPVTVETEATNFVSIKYNSIVSSAKSSRAKQELILLISFVFFISTKIK